jgi:hypothetical protein
MNAAFPKVRNTTYANKAYLERYQAHFRITITNQLDGFNYKLLNLESHMETFSNPFSCAGQYALSL